MRGVLLWYLSAQTIKHLRMLQWLGEVYIHPQITPSTPAWGALGFNTTR